jgi:hypothetical protein
MGLSLGKASRSLGRPSKVLEIEYGIAHSAVIRRRRERATPFPFLAAPPLLRGEVRPERASEGAC